MRSSSKKNEDRNSSSGFEFQTRLEQRGFGYWVAAPISEQPEWLVDFVELLVLGRAVEIVRTFSGPRGVPIATCALSYLDAFAAAMAICRDSIARNV